MIFFAYCAVLNYLKNAKVGGHVGHFSESGHQVNIFVIKSHKVHKSYLVVIRKGNFRNHSYYLIVKKAVWGNPSYSSPDFLAQFFP